MVNLADLVHYDDKVRSGKSPDLTNRKMRGKRVWKHVTSPKAKAATAREVDMKMFVVSLEIE